MLSIQGVYDGISVIPKETIPFRDECDVIITFLNRQNDAKIASFDSEEEMIDYINNIGRHYYGD